MEENQVLENVVEEVEEEYSGCLLVDVVTCVLLIGFTVSAVKGTVSAVKGVKKVLPKLKDKFGKKKQELTIDEDGIVEMIDDIEEDE
ncbi:MAG: hypothetical protein KH020_03040 [Clostridiales bacterium]|nr:hypothetical protein [Clostridiales bacterium]